MAEGAAEVNEKKQSQGTINLLLVGKTGNGLSSAFEYILKRQQSNTIQDFSTLTDGLEVGEIRLDERLLRVIGVPGICHTNIKREDQESNFRKSVTKALSKFQKEGDSTAVVLVMSYANRAVDEEKQTFQIIKNVFGQNIFSSNGVLVMTFGDNYKRDHKVKTIPEGWWEDIKQDGFLLEFGSHCFLLDNTCTDHDIQNAQISQIVKSTVGMQLVFQSYKPPVDLGYGDTVVGSKYGKSSKADGHKIVGDLGHGFKEFFSQFGNKCSKADI